MISFYFMALFSLLFFMAILFVVVQDCVMAAQIEDS